MLVIHANWSHRKLWLWGESEMAARERALQSQGSADGAADSPTGSTASPLPDPARGPTRHPFSLRASELLEALAEAGLSLSDAEGADGGAPAATVAPLRLWLPGDQHGPWPSVRLSSMLGLDQHDETPLPILVEVEAIAVSAAALLPVLTAIESRMADLAEHEVTTHHHSLSGGAAPPNELRFGHGFRFWVAAARFALDLLEDQRVVPTLVQERGGPLQAAWHPWLRDASASPRMNALIAAMPGIARAVDDDHRHEPGPILEDLLSTVIDSAVRETLRRESFEDAIEDRSPSEDPHVAWLVGLLNGSNDVPTAPGGDVALLRGVRAWLGLLDDTGEGLPYRLLMRLNEPELSESDGDNAGAGANWWLSLHLVSPDDPNEVIDATLLWSRAAIGRNAPGGERASELLLAELGRASRIWPKLEKALAESTPTGLFLSTAEAYSFLREHRGVLLESGFHVQAPEWWDQPTSRLAARLVIDSEPVGAAIDSARGRGLGLQSIVSYRWQIALGDQPITLEQFRALAERGVPLVRVGNRWVEVRDQDLAGAARFLAEHPGGEMTLLEAMRLAHGGADESSSLPIAGLEATGWVGEVFGPDADAARLESLEQPTGFLGTLRPYQKAGLSWLAFLDKFGLGGCLADDMGLGKTIQLIALLQHERAVAAQEDGGGTDEPMGPTLLVAPMSVLANWHRELNRFAPELRVHVHHGLDRPLGDDFVMKAAESDIVVTTYALVTRDRETLERVYWRRICLDEAQHIKNPPTKQTHAIRSLRTRHRVALTGTPVENRLAELWSIMEFCNPGYLGGSAEFRRRFAVPIERHRDRRQAERLRHLVRPFILRRVKTDPDVIADLPPLVETKHVVPLTTEQGALYEGVVNEMLMRVDRAEGIQRRGLVLSALVKLKQICNHPGHFLKESVGEAAAMNANALASRSGKAQRLIEMIEEVVAAGDKALIFTQYREMGHMLVAMMRRQLDVESLFLHGGTPAARRQQLIDRFQSPEGGVPIFVLSLKAGGVGLNLTAANHVFHFDRWWNPAVENQATDRAFRIGQSRTVHVHKLISAGSLEERIDQMIEQKTELASQIIGTGESWLTELSTGQLRDLFSLRHQSLAAEGELDDSDEGESA